MALRLADQSRGADSLFSQVDGVMYGALGKRRLVNGTSVAVGKREKVVECSLLPRASFPVSDLHVGGTLLAIETRCSRFSGYVTVDPSIGIQQIYLD